MRRRYTEERKELEEVTEEIKSSKTWIVPDGCTSIDVFLVGGGGGGSSTWSSANISSFSDANGGGGGYTKTYYDVSVISGQSVKITVGKGGSGGYEYASNGGYSQFMNSNYRAEGGKGAKSGYKIDDSSYLGYGGNGGSGGGGSGGNGGSNGSNGGYKRSSSVGGSGQGSSTKCPFNNKLIQAEAVLQE